MPLFEPIYTGQHRSGVVDVAPISLPDVLSVSVEDHSSVRKLPMRLWSFLDREQVQQLRDALDKWLSAEQPPAST